MLAKTGIKQTFIVLALLGMSFYAGVFWSGTGNHGRQQAGEVSALKSRLEQLEGQLQAHDRESRLLRADCQATLLEQSTNSSGAGELFAAAEPEPFSNDAERLSRAREDLWSDAPLDRIHALETLIKLSPAEAVDAIRLIMSQAGGGEDVALVASSLRYLADNQYLLNADLKQFYNSGDERLQREAANVLAQRGDDSLQQRYINQQYAIASQATDPVRRAEAVQKLTVFGKNPHAVSRILPLLEDSDSFVRLKAVSALAYTGDYSVIPAVQALLNDDVAAVRQRAEEVISALNRSDDAGLILIPPPRAIPDCLPEGD
jgi:hypothetical protein